MMKKPNECYAYFCVRGSFQPDQISERVGTKPSKSYLEGDPMPKSAMPYKCSLWALYSRLDRTSSFEQHILDVLEQLDANKRAFELLSQELDGMLELVGYFHASYPGLVFDRDVVQRLAQYSLSVDFDFYDFATEAE